MSDRRSKAHIFAGLAEVLRRLVLSGGVVMLVAVLPARADKAFEAWVKELAVEAHSFGVTKLVFEREMRGVAPDRTLPDLATSGRPKLSNEGQAEFTKPPQAYLKRDYLIALGREGRVLKERHAAALARIEEKIGVEREVVLAIWGRETAYGKYKPKHDAITVLATQAYLGRRKELFRRELLFALKLLQDKAMERREMKSSWAGAMGLPQLMPSEFENYAVDIDGDGRRDIFRSVPDALGTAARQLKAKGWVKGLAWGYEVVLGARVSCAFEGPPDERPIRAWLELGVKRSGARTFGEAERAAAAYLMSPAGSNGPSFLVTENFKVIRLYNTSDLYALFVGHLADRIAGGGDFATPWRDVVQLTGQDVGEIQERLKGLGYGISAIDGKVGSNTRRIIGQFQVRQKVMPVCWPSSGLLRQLKMHNRVK